MITPLNRWGSAPAVIKDVIVRKVFNNRGEETVEAEVITVSGFGRASAPAGVSRSKAEVAQYPEGDVDLAIKRVKEIVVPKLIGLSADSQEEVDGVLHEADGTRDFSVIGGSAALAISLANAEAAASSHGLPLFQYLGGCVARKLPYPLGNVISGGKHALGKAPDIQEFLVLPHGARSFFEAASANVRVHREIGDVLRRGKCFSGGKSDEGAWVADIGNLEALEILAAACDEVSDELGFKCGLGIDVSAQSLWDPRKGKYVYLRDGEERAPEEQLTFIYDLIKKYGLVYVEDPFHEDDYESFAKLTKEVKGCLICGDDLFSTNSERLSRGVKLCAANSVTIKVNQVGTLTDALRTVEVAKLSGYVPVMAHRSGDTCDYHIAHLAVAFNCQIIKAGIVEGSRVAKVNELIRVEGLLGDRAEMADLKVLKEG